MTRTEQGFLLLASHLGNPHRCPLSTAQLRELTNRIRQCPRPTEDRELTPADLTALGYSREMAERIVLLLSDRELLDHYLRRARQTGCRPLTRISPDYPQPLLDKLGSEAPACIWLRGNPRLLGRPAVSLVGSREIRPENQDFAREVGHQAARQGFVLISGNARGADKLAQQACLRAGGQVISVVADELSRHEPDMNMLYLSEDGFDVPFSAIRALSRNRLIHALPQRTFVAQSDHGRGGTWDGTVRNLRSGWSSVFCYQDGSDAMTSLIQMGADPISLGELHSFSSLPSPFLGLFDQ